MLAAACALVSAASMAVLVQPGVPVSEDAPIRVSAGVGAGFVKNDNGFGVNNLGLGLGFAHNVGYDFEYGVAVSGDFAKLSNARIFTDDMGDKSSGFGVGVDLLARFLPEVAGEFPPRWSFERGLGWLFGRW